MRYRDDASGRDVILSINELASACPSALRTDLERYVHWLNHGCESFRIDTPERLAAFIAQCSHESMDFMHVVENLNYSAEALQRVWPSRFPTEEIAQQYHRQPERIANVAYANRMGNGDVESGDGWRFRGRGLIQLTGRDAYERYAHEAGFPEIVSHPEMVAEPQHAAMSAAWVFGRWKDCNPLADESTEESFRTMTRMINGGLHGINDRMLRWSRAKRAFGVQ